MACGDFPSLAGKHDLRLPAWGPYTKRYIGASHSPDVQAGLRFDPGLFAQRLQCLFNRIAEHRLPLLDALHRLRQGVQGLNLHQAFTRQARQAIQVLY